MDGPLPAVFALLVVTAIVAGAAPVGSQDGVARASTVPVAQQENTTAYLLLPGADVQTVRYDTVSLDVAGAVAADEARTRARYLRLRAETAFANASSDAARRAVVNESVAALEARVANLTARERAALAAYNDHELTTQGYLRELAAVHVQAKALRGVINQVAAYNRMADTPVDPARIARIKARLVPLIGPVRAKVASAMRGQTADTRVYVETTSEGVTLAMVTNGVSKTFVRETYDGSAFSLEGRSEYNFSEAGTRLRTLYAWAAENSQGSNTLLTSSPYYYQAGIYGIAFNHPHGTSSGFDLFVYLDGHTGEVFREIQSKDLSAVPTTRAVNTTNDGLRLRIDLTHESGAMRVNVTNAATGRPVDATVYINRERVATTGADGGLWTVAPRARFNVTATVGNRTVTAGPRA